ncbi:MAG: class II aldolase/adducin family protein [Solirubrobacteraceae bacterium]
MSHVATLFDRIVEDIGEAGQQVTNLAACEGSAGNISVYVTELLCPLDPAGELELPTAVPTLAGGWVVITAGGRRLRDVSRRPASTIVALRIDDAGRTATVHGTPGLAPSSELNSHLAIHDDHRGRRGVDYHVVLHAQPLRLVYLSHLPTITTTAELTERLLRWEPETAVVASEGVELAAFQVPGSPAQMAASVEALARSSAVVWAKHGIVTRSDISATRAADLVEYLEAAAIYEVLNLSLGSPAHGLAGPERHAVAQAFGLGV